MAKKDKKAHPAFTEDNPLFTAESCESCVHPEQCTSCLIISESTLNERRNADREGVRIRVLSKKVCNGR